MSLVSILLSVYNNKEDILNAINSILDQTYSLWELIIIDDGSTDDVADIILPYINNNDKIIFKRNETNRGKYVCLNDALNMAKGDYITIIDSDDMFIVDKLQKQVDILDNNSNYVATIGMYKRDDIVRKAEITLMYRKKIINDIGYYDSIRIAADTEYYRRMKCRYNPDAIYILEEIIYYAKKRIGSLTNNDQTGLYGIGLEIRLSYVIDFTQWHESDLPKYMEYPLINRPFEITDLRIIY